MPTWWLPGQENKRRRRHAVRAAIWRPLYNSVGHGVAGLAGEDVCHGELAREPRSRAPISSGCSGAAGKTRRRRHAE